DVILTITSGYFDLHALYNHYAICHFVSPFLGTKKAVGGRLESAVILIRSLAVSSLNIYFCDLHRKNKFSF
ncbi:hypothetical protein P2F08_14390, partial [Mannheimia haemolytica]|nr:hypothetical protein [Mannheimia haemolytica]